MSWRELLIVGVQCKKWDPRIVFSPIDSKLFRKQAIWDMDSTINKVTLIRVVQKKAWWFLSKIFMESQRLKVGQLSGRLQRIIQKAGSSTLMFEID